MPLYKEDKAYGAYKRGETLLSLTSPCPLQIIPREGGHRGDRSQIKKAGEKGMR